MPQKRRVTEITCKWFKMLGWIFTTLYMVILVLVVVVDKRVSYLCVRPVAVPNKLLLPIAVFSMAALYIALLRVYDSNENRLNQQFKHHRYCRFLITVCLQVFLIGNVYFITGWDAGYISNFAAEIVNHSYQNEMLYYQRYPNNILLTNIWMIVRHAGELLKVNGYFMEVILCCVINALSIEMLVACMDEVISTRAGRKWGHGLAFLVFGFSPWTGIPYSDAIALMFPIMTIYIYIKATKEECRLPLFIKAVACMLPCVVGYLIKPQCMIVLIAIGMVECFEVFRGSHVLKRIGCLACAALCCASIGAGIQRLGYLPLHLEPDPDKELGATHFLMMGLNEERNGVYADGDVAMSSSYATKEERIKGNMQEVKNRLSSMGIPGLARHLMRKTLTAFNDGTFAWGQEGNFYREMLPEKTPFSRILRSFYYEGGENFSLFVLVSQMIWLGVLFFGLFCAQCHDKRSIVVAVSLVGIAMFEYLFECRARYLYIYSPVYTLAATMGIERLHKAFAAKLKA